MSNKRSKRRTRKRNAHLPQERTFPCCCPKTCSPKTYLQIREGISGFFVARNGEFFSEPCIFGDVSRSSRQETPLPSGITAGARRLRAGGGRQSRFRRGAGISACCGGLRCRIRTVPKKFHHSKKDAPTAKTKATGRPMGGTREEPTGRYLDPVSPFPHFRSEDNSVATSRLEVIFFSLRGRHEGIRKDARQHDQAGEGKCDAGAPLLLPGRDL